MIGLALAIIAGGAYGVTRLPGSGSSASASVSGPVGWLGIQIEGTPIGGVVIKTVMPGSAAEAAGLEPGDVITEIDSRTVSAPSDITAAIGGLVVGDQVEIQFIRGSTFYTTQATLAAHKSGSP